MSFAVLALAVEAASRYEPESDEEFGWTLRELGLKEEFVATWVLYRTEGGQVRLVVHGVRPTTVSEVLDG